MSDTSRDTTRMLVEQARAGDERALDRLCARLLPAARRWAKGRLPKGARGMLDTEDIVQETVARMAARVRRIRPDEDHGLYLYLRVALRNRVHDEWRRVHRRPEVRATLPSQVDDDRAAGPETNAALNERQERYEAALETLEPVERAMVVARLEFGLPWREIAEIANKSSEDAARVAVGRAVRKIAERLGESA